MSGNSWAVSHPGARSLPGGSRRPDRAPDGFAGVRENLPAFDPEITYVDARDGGCRTAIAGLRCPGHVAHHGPCGVRMRSETGLDYYVVWQLLGAQRRAGVDIDEVRIARDLDTVWALVTCRICGNGVHPLEREAFLRDGGHFGCLADEAHDAEVHFEAEEHFA